MKRNAITQTAVYAVLGLLLVMAGCEYKTPANVWEESQKDKNDIVPEIHQVLPKDAGSASRITINGKDFSHDPTKNAVYFNKVLAKVVSASDTQIVVYRPNIVGDSITVKVIVTGAAVVAKYGPYKLTSVTDGFGIFLDTDAIAAIAEDANENLYVVMDDGSVIKLDKDGKQDAAYKATASNLTTDLKVGPGGALFFVRKKARIYRIPPAGGNNTTYATFDDVNGDEAKAFTFDFDKNKNLFAGGANTGLLLMQADKTVRNLGIYLDYAILSIRVFNDYVYVAAEYTGSQAGIPLKGVWRNKIISAAGDVNATSELVLDWANTGEYAQTNLNAITFSSDGDLYVGTNNSSPVLVVHPNGSKETLYYGIIPSSVDQLTWGAGNYLYANINRKLAKSSGRKLQRIFIGKTSAPYYGRQ